MKDRSIDDAEKVLIKAIVRGFNRIIILWLISQRSMSGYTIIKEMERLTRQRLHAGVIYPLLYKLEEGKFISSECTQRGGRRIRYYSITEKGAQILNRLRRRFKMPVKKVLEDFIGGTRKSPL